MFNRLSHFFLPQESNNFKARILYHFSFSLIIGLILLSQLFLSPLLLVRPDVLGFASQISPERIVELTNQERAKTGASTTGERKVQVLPEEESASATEEGQLGGGTSSESGEVKGEAINKPSKLPLILGGLGFLIILTIVISYFRRKK